MSPRIKLLLFGGLTIILLIGLTVVLLSRKSTNKIQTITPDSSQVDEFNTNKQAAGDETIVIINDDYALRGYFVKIDDDEILLSGLHSEKMAALLTPYTLYQCQNRHYTDKSGKTVDSFNIYIDYSRAPAVDFKSVTEEKTGSRGLAWFTSIVKPGQPVLVRISKIPNSQPVAASVSLISSNNECTQ